MRILRLFTFFLSIFWLLAAGAARADGKPITIGVNNWAENIAVANLWKVLLEDKGYDVHLLNGNKALLYDGVARGQIDATFEVWLPSGDKLPFEKVKNRVTLIGPWFKGASLGLVVPNYVPVEGIDQLNADKDLFAPRGEAKIVGIGAGSSLMQLTEKAKDVYHLGFSVQVSSEPAMLLALKRAIQKKKPIIVTLWKPHWIWSEYKLKYLRDPKGVYGSADAIYGIESKSFKSRYPDVERWLQQWTMNDDSLGSLMAEIIKRGKSNPEKGARAWANANQSIIHKWMK